jgi:hypothetical protein
MGVDRGRSDVSGDRAGFHGWVVLLEPVDQLASAEGGWHGRHGIYEKFSYGTVVDHLRRLPMRGHLEAPALEDGSIPQCALRPRWPISHVTTAS